MSTELQPSLPAKIQTSDFELQVSRVEGPYTNGAGKQSLLLHITNALQKQLIINVALPNGANEKDREACVDKFLTHLSTRLEDCPWNELKEVITQVENVVWAEWKNENPPPTHGIVRS